MLCEVKSFVAIKPDIIYYDMYIDGVWHGSRRTLDICEKYFNWQKAPSKEK
jgi:hypothetical protein